MANGFFSKEEVYDIQDNSGNKLGIDIVTYKVLKILDTKNLMNSNTYSVTVKHRILISGSNWKPGGDYQSTGFNNYPMMVNVQSGIIEISDPAAEIILKRIFPKTINASVEQSSNLSTGSSSSQTNQTSSGSSSSNVNTFGIDISAGWFVDGPVATLGMNYSHSWEHSNFDSTSVGHSSERNLQTASGNEMSVKDWSAYSSIQNFNNTSNIYKGEYIQWNWGQTYPWNVFEYNETGAGSNITLPQSVVANLLYYGSSNLNSQNILLPPSDLSLFGLDFTMASEWLVTFSEKLTSMETLTFEHQINVLQGSHSMTVPAGGGQATLVAALTSGYNNILKQDTPLEIAEYALVPLTESQRTGIGFQSNLFDIAPASPTTAFKIRSRGNDLLVTGTGFGSVMSAAFPANYSGQGASLNIAFKVADLRTQYALILKHWKGPAGGNIVLTCNINGNQTVINVTDLEGQGSANNLSQLELSNFDLKSSNFHDYLVPGWNEIEISIKPLDNTVASEYIILALSVEG
jgi:hypothetical protein